MNNKRMKVKKKKLLVRLFALVLVIILALISILIINFYVKMSVKSKIITVDEATSLDVDCILILGAGVWGNERPSHMLEDRLLQGIELYNNGASDRLLMSGDHGRKEYDEVNVMKEFAIKNGIPSKHIFMDHAGFSTYESLYRGRDVFGAQNIIIVTQRYHLYRALYIAEKLGIKAYGVSSDPRQYAGQDVRELRETLARVKDFFNVIIKPKPTYLGEEIPVSGNGDLTNDLNRSR
ncbi:SanA/YdcF family protein [Maledivibacter halophilus]|uniref:Protein SanA, affects membrane permeability for vancomycin n=1 Tax=Maledivibacter halophilus TaxID=36842 RepID=A0A1T5KQE1_9FIRM|nr:ElyC/SanA/YdcF family protein [Maledivibacter halophilus]SKC65863.1 protein SanA, affects membrane permeability for vancomycin [Maledivibacter halophilus]